MNEEHLLRQHRWAKINGVNHKEANCTSKGARMRWLGYVATILWWSGIARSLSTLNRGYKISPKPCRGPEPGNEEGTCMFVWECIKSEGSHVGVCVDTFMFGSCCVHNSTANNVNATPVISGGSPSTRPSLAEALYTSPSGSKSPGSSQYPQRTHPATPSLGHHGYAGVTTGSSQGRPQRPKPTGVGSGPGRPAQKRPQGTQLANQDNRLTNDFHVETESIEVSETDDTQAVDQSPKYPGLGGPVDKDDVSHNTLVVKLPSRIPGQEARPHRPGYSPKPHTAQRPSESRPDDGKTEDTDLVVQATVHKPNVDSGLAGNNGAIVQKQNPNFIHTERPQWATKPNLSQKPSTDPSKPLVYPKTTTYRPGSIANAKPNFVSNTDADKISVKTTSITRPTYYSSQLTGTAGFTQHTIQWQVTTEPAFVTKQKTPTERPPTVLEATRPTVSSPQIWSENTWTPPRQSPKPHWTDSPTWFEGGPESFPSKPPGPTRPTRPNKPYQSMDYEKPLGSAHYITTSYVESSTKAKPIKKPSTTATPTTTPSGTSSTKTITTTTTRTTSAENPVTSPSSSTTASTTTKRIPGNVLTVSASTGSKETQCGVPPLFPRPETRIVGGKDAPFGRWPWQVSVRRTSFFGFSSTHRCGGAVLNENWIATAGHCVDDLLTSQIRIRVGEYDFSSVQERLPFVERAVARKVVHPKYNFFTYEYDLALVRLETSLTFAPHISPICLPATDDLLVGENATVTGWGRLSEGGTLPSVLQEVSVPIVSNERCKSMFLRAGRHEFIPEIFLCAGHEMGGQDSCQGDSGGPLQVRGRDGRYFLAGIISWGIGCAEANLPGVCTRISKFVPWILKNVT
ncbi:serine proteinase stubble isoform X2 [Athalia rosae]|uniref:serine proteinase stubble isoform X2 n=2 Tax=Athalia rosae TaxID=37344 RepID=UPI00203393CE|nr:serine proteinase stubble isoform X2 [Athalia rosae]